MTDHELTEEDLARGAAAMEQAAVTHARMHGHVIPIYAEGDNKVPFLNASGFLLRVGDGDFLVTAGHALDVYPERQLYAGMKGGHLGINAQFTRTKAGDLGDIAFARLDDRMSDLSRAYRVLTIEDIDVLDWPAPARMYSFLGYPTSLNKANLRDKTFEPTVQPYNSHLPLQLGDYERLGLNPCLTIGVFFDLSQAEEHGTANRVVPKAPKGISGGPVWRLGTFRELSERANRERLVGLGVSFEKKRKPNMLLGTRIAIVTEAIRKRFPELSDYLPKPDPRCRINLNIG